MVRTSLHDILYCFSLGLNSAHFNHLWTEGAIILNDNRQGKKRTLRSWGNINSLQNGIQVSNCFKVSVRNEELMVSMLDLRFRAAPTDTWGINLLF